MPKRHKIPFCFSILETQTEKNLVFIILSYVGKSENTSCNFHVFRLKRSLYYPLPSFEGHVFEMNTF